MSFAELINHNHQLFILPTVNRNIPSAHLHHIFLHLCTLFLGGAAIAANSEVYQGSQPWTCWTALLWWRFHKGLETNIQAGTNLPGTLHSRCRLGRHFSHNFHVSSFNPTELKKSKLWWNLLLLSGKMGFLIVCVMG